MRAVVTGAAGFIGSHLVDELLEDGHEVLGLDALTDHYDPTSKRANLARAATSTRFEWVETDLTEADLPALLDGAHVVFHLAGQPGVRPSWGSGFARYARDNVVATQRLLEAARTAPGLERIVVASSSSVYGDAGTRPSREADATHPRSPYGVSKRSAEQLCEVYADAWGVPTVLLRLFTVYGPRQRPDMALHRLCEAAITGAPFPRFGSGRARRDLTYVGDAVAAFRLAAAADVAPATTVNVAGGSPHSLNELVELVGTLSGTAVAIDDRPAQAGDVDATAGDISVARRSLGWTPTTQLADGIGRQLAWHRDEVPATISR